VEFTSSVARDRYDAFVAVASRAIVGLDMDGTLSPIVDDPALAHIHPDIPDALTDLAAHILAVAIITGRPARQALALGGLDEVGDAVGEMGKELFVLGQYGNERWTSSSRRIVSPRPPHGLASFLTELTGVLRKADAVDAFVEEKGLAVAVHTRRLADPAAALARISGPMTELATRHGLVVEPGRGARRGRVLLRRRRPRRRRGLRSRRAAARGRPPHPAGLLGVPGGERPAGARRRGGPRSRRHGRAAAPAGDRRRGRHGVTGSLVSRRRRSG
jgi:hypothetical protein